MLGAAAVAVATVLAALDQFGVIQLPGAMAIWAGTVSSATAIGLRTHLRSNYETARVATRRAYLSLCIGSIILGLLPLGHFVVLRLRGTPGDPFEGILGLDCVVGGAVLWWLVLPDPGAKSAPP